METANKFQVGATLIELIFVVAIMAGGSILTFEIQTADLQSNSAKDVGVHLRKYGKAVQNWVNDNPGASGTYNGTKWLKSTSCGGLSPAPGYIDCSFYDADATNPAKMDPISPGSMTLSTVVSSSDIGQLNTTRAVTTTTPYVTNNKPRADLSGIAAITAAIGTSVDRSSFGIVTSNPLEARIVIVTEQSENEDIWLKLDGSNALNGNLVLDGPTRLTRRILGASSIQSYLNKPLILGRDTGSSYRLDAGLVVDSDVEIYGTLLANSGIDSGETIQIKSGSVSIPQGKLITKQGFANRVASSHIANPASISKLTSLTLGGLASIRRDVSPQGGGPVDPFLWIKKTVIELTTCLEPGQASTDAEGNLMSCRDSIWQKVGKNPLLHRYVFTSNGTWEVPENVNSAFITLAGGGGSGYGWRVESHTRAGSSGGFLFNESISVTPGETLKIIVGEGGKGFAPLATGTLSDAGFPFFIYTGNPSDPGLIGLNGSSSKVISGEGKNLVECSGGGGAGENYADPNGRPAGGPSSVNIVPFMPAAYVLAHNDGIHSIYGKNRDAGVCGPNNYGLGISGLYSYTNVGTILFGGRTPISYGSGGDVTVTRCYVSKSDQVACKFPQNGKNGVVMIDVFY